MDQAARPAWPWRLFAWLLLVLGAAISLPALLVIPASGMIYILIVWFALGGTMAYAYGQRARPLWFWRLFASIFSLWVMWDVGGKSGRILATFRSGAEMSGGHVAVFLVAVPLHILLCVALLRHARLLRGGQRSQTRALEEVFA